MRRGLAAAAVMMLVSSGAWTRTGERVARAPSWSACVQTGGECGHPVDGQGWRTRGGADPCRLSCDLGVPTLRHAENWLLFLGLQTDMALATPGGGAGIVDPWVIGRLVRTPIGGEPVFLVDQLFPFMGWELWTIVDDAMALEPFDGLRLELELHPGDGAITLRGLPLEHVALELAPDREPADSHRRRGP